MNFVQFPAGSILPSTFGFPFPSLSAPSGNVAVNYDLCERDSSNKINTGTVKMSPSDLIADLQQKVFNANSCKLRDCDYSDLKVYPPGTTDWNVASATDKEIGQLLPREATDSNRRRCFTVIAPPVRGSRMRSIEVPEHVRAVVGRVVESVDEQGVVVDFVKSTIGSGVWFGKGGVVLTAYHNVVDVVNPIFFYLYNSSLNVWSQSRMQVVAFEEHFNITVLQQEASDSDDEPQVIDTLVAQRDADIWNILFPQVIDTDAKTSVSSSSNSTASSSAITSSSHLSSSTVSLSLSSSLSSSPPAPSSSLSTFTLSSSSAISSSSSSSPSALPSEADWHSGGVVITKGIISNIGFGRLFQVADYISAPNSSGGAVVGQLEDGAWYLIGIHLNAVHHNIDFDEKTTLQQQITQASGTSEFISIHSIQSWYEKAMPANGEVFNSANKRKFARIEGKRKRKRTGSTAEATEELVFETRKGWVGYYDRRFPPVPLPASRRTQTETTTAAATIRTNTDTRTRTETALPGS